MVHQLREQLGHLRRFSGESGNFLEWNSGASGPEASIYQDVSTQPTSGEDYQGTLMVRSPAGTPLSLQLYLWAIGGTSANVAGSTSVTVSSTTWQPVSVVLHVPSSGYTDMRLQLYTSTTGDNIDVDAGGLTDAGLTNSNFENGVSGWTSSPNGMNEAVYNGSAYADNTFLEMNTGTQTSATVSSNTPFSVAPGPYNAYVALRSPDGTPANVRLRLYTTGGTTEVSVSSFTVSSPDWTIYSVELDVGATGHTGLDFRVGVVTSGVNVDVDTADVVMPHSQPVASTGDCTPTNSCSPVSFSDALLAEPQISAPATGPNVYALEVWMRPRAVGRDAQVNPPTRHHGPTPRGQPETPSTPPNRMPAVKRRPGTLSACGNSRT